MELDYKELFERQPSLSLVITPEFIIVGVTDAYLKATMTKREEILGHGIFEIFPDNPNDLQADGVSNLRASLNRVLQKKAVDHMAVQKYDIRKPESEGGEFEVRYWSPINIPVLTENGNVKLIIHRVEDVTEFVSLEQEHIKQAETNSRLKSISDSMEVEILQRNKEIKNANIALSELNSSLITKSDELKRSNEELSSFAATASHDIKAPFRSVGGQLEIIKSKIGNIIDHDEEVQEAFSRITSARTRIATLLDDLLKFAKITQDKTPLTSIDVSKVMDDVLKNMEFNINEKKAKIVVNGPLPFVKGQFSQLTQLFQNVIGNAIKFQDKNIPQIIISVVAKNNGYQFSVKDNGIGIEPQYFNKIFQVFERLHGQAEFSGTGLGLSICKRIVEHHGGKIWVESKLGEGTTFYFTLQKAN